MSRYPVVEVHSPIRWMHKPRGEADVRQHVLRKEFNPKHWDGVFLMLCGAELCDRMTGQKTKKPKITIGPREGIVCCPKCLAMLTKRQRRRDKSFASDSSAHLEQYTRPWQEGDGDTCIYSGRSRACGPPSATRMVPTGKNEKVFYRTEPVCNYHRSGEKYTGSLVRLAEVRKMADTGEARSIRVRAHLSMHDIAQSIGVHQSTIWNWENGKRKIPGERGALYLKALEDLVSVVGP